MFIPIFVPIYCLIEFTDNLLDWLYLARASTKISEGIRYLEMFKDAVNEAQNSGPFNFISVDAKSKGHSVRVRISTL